MAQDVNTLASKADDLSLMTETHMVKRESWLPQVVY